MDSPTSFSSVVMDVLERFSTQNGGSVHWRKSSSHHVPGNHQLSEREVQDFRRYEMHARELDEELRVLLKQVSQLRNSALMSEDIKNFRLHLDQLRDILRANMEDLSSSSVEKTHLFSSASNIRLLPRYLKLTARDAQNVLSRLEEYSAFTEEDSIADEVESSIKEFAKDSLYLEDCLGHKTFQLEDIVTKRYIHGLLVGAHGIGQHLADLHGAFQRFRSEVLEQGPKHIEAKQKKRISDLQNISTVSTLFSGVTATTLQFSYGMNENRLQYAVNFFWFTSLVFSIASAVNALQAVTWQQARYAQVPHWVYYWVRGAPLLFLVLSVVSFSVGLVLFAFSSPQRFYTSVVTSAFTGISLIGLVAVSVWFALARLTSESDPQAKRIRILLAIIQRLLNQPVDEVERLASAAIGQLSSDKGDKKRQRRLYILQSFALAVQREKDLFELIKAPKHISAYARIEWPASQNTTSMPSMALKDSIQLRSLAAAGTVHPHLRIIRNFAFSPSGKLLASASTDRTVSIFSLSKTRSNTSVLILPHPNDDPRQVLWSPSENQILVRLNRGYKIWSRSGRVHRLIDRSRDVSSAIWLKQGEAFLSVEGDEVVSLDTNGKELDSYRFNGRKIYDIALIKGTQRLIAVGELSESPNGLKPVRVAKQKCIILYDMERKKLEREIVILGDIRVVEVSKEGKYALVSFVDKAAPQLWCLESNSVQPQQDLDTDESHKLTEHKIVDANNATFYDHASMDQSEKKIASEDHKAHDLPSLSLARTFTPEDQSKPVGPSYFCGSNDEWVSSLNKDGYIHVWHRDSGVLLARFQPQPENPGRTMAWNKHARDGPMLATGTGDGSVRLWSPKNLEPSIAESHDGHVTAGIFTPYSEAMIPGINDSFETLPRLPSRPPSNTSLRLAIPARPRLTKTLLRGDDDQ